MGKWIRKLERYYDKSATSQLSIATALSDYYNTNKKGKKAKYWIDIQKKLSIQNNNFVQLGNAYVTEATVAVAEKDKKLLYNVINDIINEKRIPQQAVTIAFNTCLVFGYNYLDKKELEILYSTIAQNDSLSLQELLNAADNKTKNIIPKINHVAKVFIPFFKICSSLILLFFKYSIAIFKYQYLF